MSVRIYGTTSRVDSDPNHSWEMYILKGDLVFQFHDTTASPSGYNGRVAYLQDTLLGGIAYNNIEVTGYNSFPVSFTGSHINTVRNTTFHDNKYIGLIFSINPQYKYIDLNGRCIPRISESLPVLELCTEDKCKRVFGVLASLDTSVTRTTPIKFTSENEIFNNELQTVMNSLGEGGVWVCNKNGNLETGDMITSSVVPGYGVLQDDDLHHSYTVGKITCDCDFSLIKEKKQNLVHSIDSSYNRTIILSDNGNIQYEDTLDLSGNPFYGYKYVTRFLLPDGTILDTEEEYHSRKANGEDVFIACFVGCVYYCG